MYVVRKMKNIWKPYLKPIENILQPSYNQIKTIKNIAIDLPSARRESPWGEARLPLEIDSYKTNKATEQNTAPGPQNQKGETTDDRPDKNERENYHNHLPPRLLYYVIIPINNCFVRVVVVSICFLVWLFEKPCVHV